MDTEVTIENDIISKRVEELPDEIVALLVSTDTTDQLRDLGKRHANLSDEQLDILEVETGFLLLGDYDLDEYPGILQVQINISEEQANLLAEHIQEEVFKENIDMIRAVSELYAAKSEGEEQVEDTEQHIEEQQPIETLVQSIPLDIPGNPNVPLLSEPQHKEATEVPQNNTEKIENTPVVIPVPTPPPTEEQKTPAPSIIDAKLNQTTSLPKEDVNVPGYTGSDPYRESLE